MAGAVDQHNKSVLSELEPGDMVEFKRGVYSHFGVYVGNGEIVHLTIMPVNGGYAELKDKTKIYLDNPSQPSPSGRIYGKAWVKKDKLMDVAGDCKAYKANRDDVRKPLPNDQIVKFALSKIGDVGYNLINYNCEHFANWCRYGKKISDQVDTLVNVAEVVVLKGKECVVAFLREEADKVTFASH